MSGYQQEKQLIRVLFAAMADGNATNIGEKIRPFLADDYVMYACYPFNKIEEKQNVFDNVWSPIYQAFGRIQRRQDVFIAGTSEINGENWVMSMGHFMGLFDQDWLGIRATKQTVMLRYAEFYCVESGKITKSSFFVDLIGLMQQVGLNPLPLQTGASFLVPGPETHDGLQFNDVDPQESVKTLELLNKMIDGLSELNKSGNDNCPPAFLAQTWDEDMAWYGPAGIGSVHTIERYQQHHQYPFREGLKGKTFNGHLCRFAEGDYACFFGWPNLTNTAIGGFLGLTGGDVPADMRVVDVYRREGDKLKENWVIIDLPYWLKQQGLDILERTAKIANPK